MRTLNFEAEITLQDQRKYHVVEKLLKIDILGVFSILLLVWLGIQYIIGVFEGSNRTH